MQISSWEQACQQDALQLEREPYRYYRVLRIICEPLPNIASGWDSAQKV